MKNILFTTTKLYNDFLFIKNVIEIDCNDMRTELEIFSIKDFLIYSIELLLSKTKEWKVNLIIDPCLPEEVEGDLCKFRQIITALLDFSLKSTETVEIKVDVHFKREYEGYNIDFRISLYPKFELKQEDLQLLFIFNKDDTILRSSRLQQSVGLPLHIVANLVWFLDGIFNEPILRDDGKLIIDFSIPFNSIKSTKIRAKTPKIKMNNQITIDKDVILLKSPVSIIKKVRISEQNLIKGSSKSIMSLYKIEEEKSANMSWENLNYSDISSIRETIQNFEKEELKVKLKEGKTRRDSSYKNKWAKSNDYSHSSLWDSS